MRILIIDDEKDYLSLMEKAAVSGGYEVVTATNGRVGLKLAERQSFDLIITDIFMPEMDGIALTMALRKKLSKIPVIAISGGGKFGGLQALKASKPLGATYTLAKPFDFQEFLDLIRTALGSSDDVA